MQKAKSKTVESPSAMVFNSIRAANTAVLHFTF